ncbi:protein phosphatase CheZ [Photobacterium toruni]|uniref:Protein phosphatase CheZ n=1 Tax=Photobacterium toruni TaxID=1935446 RepID=A0A1T4K5S6_9GAMM|nr:protein phosphatase CheZ [Photobacterium toruni]MEC6813959.1 protein phosphatase CheZ [Photobacterium toruni]MEC6832370.1 protein phosphatase CheZ [Photobacterium toruni]SJZ37808.1 chemotaxis regulator CheZ [Photobacterium toruni]
MISLEQAQQLVVLLEQKQQQQANTLVQTLVERHHAPMYEEVGKMTRQLHDCLVSFRQDLRWRDLAETDIPDARDSLSYVIDKTESAANRTMDAVEITLPIAEQLQQTLQSLHPQWQRLMIGKIALTDFKQLCHDINALLLQVDQDSSLLREHLTDILMAQDFQDLTGQVIRRVITLVHEVEQRMLDVLQAFGLDQASISTAKQRQPLGVMAEGPIINPQQRKDTVSSQDDVDDLLSNLGF